MRIPNPGKNPRIRKIHQAIGLRKNKLFGEELTRARTPPKTLGKRIVTPEESQAFGLLAPWPISDSETCKILETLVTGC
jgi:hypothetical protein